MKKTFVVLSILLICCCFATAQLPANRTIATKIADALAQLPAQQQEQYNDIMNDLLSTGEEGTFIMIKMINPPGKGSNTAVDYALSGLSRYVTVEGKEKDRLMVVGAYTKALDSVSDKEIKAFIIRQLAIAGRNESVETLAKYLNIDGLSGPATRALASICTPEAQTALLNVLPAAGETQKKDIIKALGDIELPLTEKPLLTLLRSGDKDMKKVVLYALSRCGSKKSLPSLAKAAEKAEYMMDYTGANEAYILLIKKVLKQGNIKEAEKAAADLMKKSTKANRKHTRIAALEILLNVKPEERNKLVLNALDDPDNEFRSAVLSYASEFADASLISGITSKLEKANPELQIVILDWLGNQRNPSVTPILPAYLNNEDPEVGWAAGQAIVKIGGESAIPLLANLLTSDDPQQIALAKVTLSSLKGNIVPEVVKAMNNAQNAGVITGMELLAERKADAYSVEIFKRFSDPNGMVRIAALKALKDVVVEKNLPELFLILDNNMSMEAVAPLQQAIIAALSFLPKERQFEMVLPKMKGGGKRYQYYMILAATGQKQALPIIKQALNTERGGTTKSLAFEAYLSLIESPEYSPENKTIFLRDAMELAESDDMKNDILKKIGNTETFQAMMYAGSYLDNEALKQTAATAIMNIALKHPEYTGDIVRELLTRTATILKNQDAEYQRQAIRNHLSEMPKGKGFISIFNGKDLSGWKGLVKNPIERAKMKPAELNTAQAKADELARQAWSIEDGVLMFNGKGDNLCTDKLYGDFELYVDWKLYPGPEPDAGIYLRGTPQVQIWDTSRVNVGARVGSGGLYNNAVNPRNPLVVADNPLNEWNSFHIQMIGERVTVYLNGELVVDNVILENYWDRKLPIFPVEQIELQAHGSKVAYRDIYIREIEQVKPFELSDEEKEEGFRILFDGATMNEWTGNTTDYTTKDGCIVLNPKGRSGGNLYTKTEYADFIYRFEFQLTSAANNGIGIRTPMEGDAAYVGMEIQVLDNEAPVYKDLQKYQYHGSVYGIIPAKRGFLKPVGEWNTEEIYAYGDHIRVTLNGEIILDGNIREATQNGTPDHREHPGLFNKKGHIGFLGHGSEVRFRNIRIRELK